MLGKRTNIITARRWTNHSNLPVFHGHTDKKMLLKNPGIQMDNLLKVINKNPKLYHSENCVYWWILLHHFYILAILCCVISLLCLYRVSGKFRSSVTIEKKMGLNKFHDTDIKTTYHPSLKQHINQMHWNTEKSYNCNDQLSSFSFVSNSHTTIDHDLVKKFFTSQCVED